MQAWRSRRPEDAGIGATPAILAKCASLAKRSAVDVLRGSILIKHGRYPSLCPGPRGAVIAARLNFVRFDTSNARCPTGGQKPITRRAHSAGPYGPDLGLPTQPNSLGLSRP